MASSSYDAAIRCVPGPISGSVNVLIKDPVTGADNVVATLYSGDSFGELALLQEGNLRAASITTKDESEFLTIGRVNAAA